MKDETPDLPQQRSGEIITNLESGQTMPMLKFEPDGISPDQEIRATSLTLAVEYAKGWNHPSTEDVFSVADEMALYIRTGEYRRR